MKKVLICDDSLVARKQVAKCIPDELDASIQFAKNGVEAVATLKGDKFDLLLLDLNMPTMDGYRVLDTLNQLNIQCQTIVISGDVQPKAMKRVKELGALEFIRKPVDATRLKEAMEKHHILAEEEPVEDPELDNDLDPDLRDVYQEITNVAMGQAGENLARFLNVFVELPIPNVNLIEVGELHMMLQQIDSNEQVSAVCQGFVGSGICGEAMIIFNDASFSEIADLVNLEAQVDDRLQLEMLMDAANILIGSCLNGLAVQLDVYFSQGHPVVLGQHQCIQDLIKLNKADWTKTLAIEISYGIEASNVHCDLILMFTEESMDIMNNKLAHLLED